MQIPAWRTAFYLAVVTRLLASAGIFLSLFFLKDLQHSDTWGIIAEPLFEPLLYPLLLDALMIEYTKMPVELILLFTESDSTLKNPFPLFFITLTQAIVISLIYFLILQVYATIFNIIKAIFFRNRA